MENIIDVIVNIWGILALISMVLLVFSRLFLIWTDHIKPLFMKK